MGVDDAADDPGDDLAGVGDGREKHVSVVTRNGERTEHPEVYLRHTDDAFVVSPGATFSDPETTWYDKEDLDRVEIGQHHTACFITTAAAGEGPTLDALRGFRDDAMARTPPGRSLVGIYDAVSPPVAETIERHPNSRTARAVRWLVEWCARLARRRERADAAVARLAISAVVTLAYALGLSLAATGHACIRLREAVEPTDSGP
jgi:hypothetical protein